MTSLASVVDATAGPSSVADAAAGLASTFSGQLLKPGDTGYDEARRVHNGLVDKRPALIARCRKVSDSPGDYCQLQGAGGTTGSGGRPAAARTAANTSKRPCP